MTDGIQIMRLEENRVPVSYEGGHRISEFRRSPKAEGPEDWVGSCTRLPPSMIPDGAPEWTGVSPTPSGPLDVLIAENPVPWLGASLARELNDEPGILVKLLHAGVQLPVHCHPSRAFAAEHLKSRYGKTEGWLVLSAHPGSAVHLGMKQTIDTETFRAWIDDGDTQAMLGAMHRLPVRAGDVIYVPAGVPHSMDPGILVLELQEPVTMSVAADHGRFGMSETRATLGLGWDTALSCFDLQAVEDANRFRSVSRIFHEQNGSVRSLFPLAADKYFRAWQISPRGGTVTLTATFAVVVVTQGSGVLRDAHGNEFAVRGGETLIAPHSAGPLTVHGDLETVMCLPPATEEGSGFQ